MPITPFSTPAQQQFIPLQDYTPVEMIGNVINKLDARQAAGLDAADKLDMLQQELLQNVLPEQRQFAEESMAGVKQQMAEMAASGDYIDALPKIRRLASETQKNFQLLNQNYSLVNERRKAIEEALAKDPNAFTQGDIEDFLAAPRQALAEDPTAVFNAPALTPRVDRFKLLNDFFKDMDPDQEVEFRDRNGMIVKTTVKELSREDILQAGESILRNNPAIQQETERDFRRFKRQLGEGAADQFAWNQWENIEQQKAQVEADQNLTDEDKAVILEQLTGAQDMLNADPESAFRSQFFGEDVARSVEPFLNKAFRQESATLQSNPYALEDYRQRNRMVIEGIRDRRAARTAQKNNSDALYTFSSAGRAPSPVPAGGNITSTLQQGQATIDELRSQMATMPPEARGEVQAQIDDLEMRQSLVQGLYDQAIADRKLNPEALEQLENGKPQIPSGVPATRLQELAKIAESLPSRSGGGQLGLGRYSTKIAQMTEAERQYVRDYENWYKDLTSAQKDLNKEVNKWFEEWSTGAGATAVPERVMDGGQDNTRLKNFVNGPTGVMIYKGTPEDGEQIANEDAPELTDIQRYTTIPLGMPDGTQAYRITARDKDGELYTAVVTDENNFREYLTRTELEGLAINGSYFGMLLHGVADGLSIEPKINGANPLGEGGKITRRGNNFVFTDANGKVQRFPMEEAIMHLENERNPQGPQ